MFFSTKYLFKTAERNNRTKRNSRWYLPKIFKNESKLKFVHEKENKYWMKNVFVFISCVSCLNFVFCLVEFFVDFVVSIHSFLLWPSKNSSRRRSRVYCIESASQPFRQQQQKQPNKPHMFCSSNILRRVQILIRINIYMGNSMNKLLKRFSKFYFTV